MFYGIGESIDFFTMNLLYYENREIESRDFRTISSRTLTSDFQMFGDNLKRLINFILYFVEII